MNSLCLCALVLCLLFDSSYSDYYTPCPDVLNFYVDGGTVYGKLKVEPEEVVSTLEVTLKYTVLSDLDEYLGNLRAPENVMSKYNRGETVYYRLHLPLVAPWPSVTEIAVNGKTICTGPGDSPRPNKILSSPTISQTSSYGFGNGPPPFRRFHHETFTQRIPQKTLFDSDFGDNEYIKSFVKKHFDTDFDAHFAVTEEPITPRPTTPRPTTPRPTTPRPTPTTPEYVAPVTQRARPVQSITRVSTTTEDCGVVASDSEIRPLINDGLSYERGQLPWLVAIYKSVRNALSVMCGGTLVSDRHVVTAAHCLPPKINISNVIIRVGVHKLLEWSDNLAVIAKPIAADIHNDFNPENLKSDIMVFTLDKRVNFNNFIRPACLWSGNTELSRIVGNTGVVAGWGGINKYHSATLDEPQMVYVPIVSTKDCRASKAAFHKLTSENTLCAGSRTGDGPCQGDSGGGLYLKEGGKWRLRGVVSLSLKNEDISDPCNLDEYVVYTDTAQFLSWIRSILTRKYFD